MGNLSKSEIRRTMRYLYCENQKFSWGFVELPKWQWQARAIPGLTRVYLNRYFLVQVFEGKFTRLSVNRTQIDETGAWKEGISWDELQTIKDECGFADCDAVEAHPRKCDIVNKANMRHLWIVPREFAEFFWRDGNGSGLRLGNTAEDILNSAERTAAKE